MHHSGAPRREIAKLRLELEPRHCEERSDEAIQLLPPFVKAGLLRGACHRARIRATRWLAMTANYSDGQNYDDSAFNSRLS
jgi:hypothetical protein